MDYNMPMELCVLRDNRKPAVVSGNPLRKECIGLLYRLDVMESEHIREPPLQCSPQTLYSSLCLWRVSSYELYVQSLARLLPLGFCFLYSCQLLLDAYFLRAFLRHKETGRTVRINRTREAACPSPDLRQKLIISEQALILTEI